MLTVVLRSGVLPHHVCLCVFGVDLCVAVISNDRSEQVELMPRIAHVHSEVLRDHLANINL